MEEENQDVQEVESSTIEDVEVESSTTTDEVEEVESSTAEAEPQEPEVKEPPFHEHPRWKEVQEEKLKAREEAAYWRAKAEQPKQPEKQDKDPYDGMSAEELQFYRNMDTRTRRLIQEEANKLATPLMQQNQVLAQKVAQIMEKDFRVKHTDVQPDSTEEREIAALINKGFDPDKAAWAVMGEKRVEAAKTGGQQATQKKIKQKQQANLETSSVPTTNPLPKGKRSFTEELDKAMRDAGM